MQTQTKQTNEDTAQACGTDLEQEVRDNKATAPEVTDAEVRSGDTDEESNQEGRQNAREEGG